MIFTGILGSNHGVIFKYCEVKKKIMNILKIKTILKEKVLNNNAMVVFISE